LFKVKNCSSSKKSSNLKIVQIWISSKFKKFTKNKLAKPDTEGETKKNQRKTERKGDNWRKKNMKGIPCTLMGRSRPTSLWAERKIGFAMRSSSEGGISHSLHFWAGFSQFEFSSLSGWSTGIKRPL
jgi:hypothetical protein